MQNATPNLAFYDHIIVGFSGGKDSVACVLHLLDLGVDPSRIELWHHDVDGREGSRMMDWAVTRAYCSAFAEAIGAKLYFSWKVGGFEREMLRDGAATAPSRFETPEGVKQAGGVRGTLGTRLKFPQVSADLSVRWCSAYLKIDVASLALNNQERFLGRRTLFITGERAEESAARAKYATFEPHRTDNRDGKRNVKHVDHWRPVHGWKEAEVWAIIERFRINPHPAYRLGWGRVSCAACIFGSPDQWASLKAVNPCQFEAVAGYEESFGVTIQRKRSIRELAAAGTPYAFQESDRDAAVSETWDEPMIVPEGAWKLPAGAFGESCGPI